MQNQDSKMNQSVAGDKGLSRKEEIDHFLSSHSTKSQLHDVSVKEMRHYIPLFLMEVYSDTYGLYAKKVKGLWEKCPDDWRQGIPFVDPNNKLKSDDGKNCKPKKEPLNQMLKYLIERYLEKQKNEPFKFESVGDILSNSNFLQTQMSFNLVETDEASSVTVRPSTSSIDHHSMYSASLTLNSGSYLSANQMSSTSVFDSGNVGDDNSLNLYLDQENPLFEGVFDMEAPTYPPKQAVDNEDTSMGEDWDPVTELKQRIMQKLKFIRKQKLVSGSDFQSLEARYNSLREPTVVDEANCCSVIDELHSLEKDIDKLRFSKRCSSDIFSETSIDGNQFSMKTPDEACTDLPVEVPVAVQDPTLISSLNIKARRGGAKPSGTIGHLQLRSGHGPLSEKQNTASLKTGSLSEYCHPVQPTEDDNLTESSQNTMLAYEFLFSSLDHNSVPFEDKMSELQLTDVVEENRIVTPVQETGVANIAAPDAVADFGSASASSLHSIAIGSAEFSSAMSLPSILDLENSDTDPQELIRILQQCLSSIIAVPQPSTELAQTAMDTAQQPLFTAQPPMTTVQPPMFATQSPMTTVQPPMFATQSPMTTMQPPMFATQLPMATVQPSMFATQSPMTTAQPRPFSVGLQPQATYSNRSQINTGGKRGYPFDDDDDDDVEMAAAPSQSIPNPEAGFGSLIPTTVEELSDIVNLPNSKNKKTRRSTWKDRA